MFFVVALLLIFIIHLRFPRSVSIHNIIDSSIKQVRQRKEQQLFLYVNSISCKLKYLIFQENLITDTSPVCVAKAVKNEVEIEGMKQAHVIRNKYILYLQRTSIFIVNVAKVKWKYIYWMQSNK